jgi:glycosyltransferase involved in cell wall biosynthesis
MQYARPGGIFNYLSNLCEGLGEYGGLELSVLRYDPSTQEISGRDLAPPLPRASPLFLSLRNLMLSATPLDSGLLGGVDVFHITTWGASYTPLLMLRRLKGVEIVVTVHDIGNVLFPQLYTHGLLEKTALLQSLKLLGRSATAVIAISESTKRDLIDIAGVPEGKIYVIYEGIDDCFRPIARGVAGGFVRENYGVSGRYALYVGGVHPRKNLHRLLRAFHSAKSEGIPWDLLLVGVTPDELRAISGPSNVGMEGCRALGYVPQEHLPYLYAACEAFVFPSLYEGFGLPVLEAMACGSPVIASNTSSMPELVDGVGLLVDPHDVDNISRSMLSLSRDQELRSRLKQKGIERARLFSWDRTVKETVDVYEKCLM